MAELAGALDTGQRLRRSASPTNTIGAASRGNPDKLMQRYFDAHVYVANWMTAIFMVRLPIEALTRETVKAVAAPYLLDIKPTKFHWIITWSLEESENYDRFGMEDGRGWIGASGTGAG